MFANPYGARIGPEGWIPRNSMSRSPFILLPRRAIREQDSFTWSGGLFSLKGILYTTFQSDTLELLSCDEANLFCIIVPAEYLGVGVERLRAIECLGFSSEIPVFFTKKIRVINRVFSPFLLPY